MIHLMLAGGCGLAALASPGPEPAAPVAQVRNGTGGALLLIAEPALSSPGSFRVGLQRLAQSPAPHGVLLDLARPSEPIRLEPEEQLSLEAAAAVPEAWAAEGLEPLPAATGAAPRAATSAPVQADRPAQVTFSLVLLPAEEGAVPVPLGTLRYREGGPDHPGLTCQRPKDGLLAAALERGQGPSRLVLQPGPAARKRSPACACVIL